MRIDTHPALASPPALPSPAFPPNGAAPPPPPFNTATDHVLYSRFSSLDEPQCKTEPTRTACTDLLRVLSIGCRICAERWAWLAGRLQMRERLRVPADAWHYDPSQQRCNSTGHAGMIHTGTACDMASGLPPVFMHYPFRFSLSLSSLTHTTLDAAPSPSESPNRMLMTKTTSIALHGMG